MVDAKPIFTPMATSVTLSAFDGEVFNDPTLYRSTIGAFQYLSITRPDIAFSVNRLSQFMHNPRLSHWQATKRLLRYLKQTIQFGLKIQRSSSHILQAFSDANMMIFGLHVDFVFILEIILFLRVARNKQLWHVQALKLNTNP